MNKVFLMGRLTATPELKATPNGVNVCSFNIAVNRRFKNSDGEYETDFFKCVAWRQTADFICRNWEKGQPMMLEGELRPNSWTDNEGRKVSALEVVVSEAHFAGGKKKTQETQDPPSIANTSDFSTEVLHENPPF